VSSCIHLIVVYSCVYTHHSRFIPEGVAEVFQIFLRDTHVLLKLVSYEEHCRRDRWYAHRHLIAVYQRCIFMYLVTYEALRKRKHWLLPTRHTITGNRGALSVSNDRTRLLAARWAWLVLCTGYGH
jgi:hypothetical protein